MKNQLPTLLCAAMLLCSACAFHNGTFESSVAITNNQFRMVGMGSGNAQTTHILGIGGLTKDALVYEAKRDLYSKYPLTKGMAFTNATVDFRRSFFLIAMTSRVTITADIIDFNPDHFGLQLQGFFTDDSTFFPTPRATGYSKPGRYLDQEANDIKVGDKVSFWLNGTKTQGVVKELNRYGVKCEYQGATGSKKIYLQPDYLTVVQ